MAATRKTVESSRLRRPPATTPEARENQLIALAVGLAEKQLADGTATAQVMTHFLKLATTRERLEQKKITLENNLLATKAEAIASGKHIEELYNEALNAMRTYSGQEPKEEYDD